MLSQVHGQSEGVQYLTQVVRGSMRVPLLLVGDEGVGRRFSVVSAAKELFREDVPERCSQCHRIDHGIHPDFKVLAAEDGDRELKVGAVRELLGATGFRPTHAPLKFFVIDGVDHMTTAAANALLKTLEESPSELRFFLLAEDAARVLPTIRSRCATVRYRPLDEAFILQTLLQHTEDETKALVCCRLAGGSMGRAIKYLGSGRLMLRDQMLSLFRIGPTRDLAQLFSAVDTVASDLPQGLLFCEYLLHDLVLLDVLPSHVANIDVLSDLKALKAKLGDPMISKLRSGLKTVQRSARGNISLPFHVKSWLASAFV